MIEKLASNIINGTVFLSVRDFSDQGIGPTFADSHQANWFHAGWSEFHTPSLKGGDEDADEVNAAVIPWLEAHGGEDDYFLHIQYWDPHRNYTVAQKWVDLYAEEPPPDWPDETAIGRQQANYGPFSASELFPYSPKSSVSTMPDRITNVADFKKFVDGYDGAIRYMDDQIGQIFQTLADLGVLDETVVIMSADHGEAMGSRAFTAIMFVQVRPNFLPHCRNVSCETTTPRSDRISCTVP